MLEGVEVLRRRRHGTGRSLVTSGSDRDLTSVRLLALTWWPAVIGALAAAAWLPRLDIGERRRTRCVLAGMAVTGRSPIQPAYRNNGLLTAIIEAGNASDGDSSVLAAAWSAASITPPFLAANSPGPGTHCAAVPATSKMARPGDPPRR